MGEGSFHWDSSYLSWHSYTSITGLGSEVRWETPAGQVGVLSWARGSKSRGQERASCELAWGEILHFLSFWHCDFLMADWSFTDFLFCGTTSCSLCFGKQKCPEAAKERQLHEHCSDGSQPRSPGRWSGVRGENQPSGLVNDTLQFLQRPWACQGHVDQGLRFLSFIY